jgi:hypothetical protein
MLPEPVSPDCVKLPAVETIRHVFDTERLRRFVVAYSLVDYVWHAGDRHEQNTDEEAKANLPLASVGENRLVSSRNVGRKLMPP